MRVAAEQGALVDWATFSTTRSETGAAFGRILGYFREDGYKSVAAIEEAVRAQNAAAMVIPAHTLKGESRQFGAEPLSDLAEVIEMIARDCLETRDPPIEAVEHVAALRPLFEQTLLLLDREANPLVQRTGGFGKRPVFGRAAV